MSLNSLLEEKHLPQIVALMTLVSEFIASWKAATTLEEKLVLESEVLTLFENLLEKDLELEKLLAGQHPELGEINGVYRKSLYLMRLNIAKLRTLAEAYLRAFNTSQIALEGLSGKSKRISQKLATLGLWDGQELKYAYAERFLTFDRLASDFHSLPVCDVDTEQGLVTLPVRSRTWLPVFTVKIGSGSNGQPGNSSTGAEVPNINPENIFDKEPDTWFEYERLDSGPVQLELILEFSQKQILNSISVDPLSLGINSKVQIDDILFSSSGKPTVSIKELANRDVPADFWQLSTGKAWNVTFLPTATKTVVIKLRSNSLSVIDVAQPDGSISKRSRYAIALKSIDLYRLTFEESGGINSLPIQLPQGLYATMPIVEVLPKSSAFSRVLLETSFDGGETWEDQQDVSEGFGRTILLDGSGQDMLWRLSLERNSVAFENLDSFSLDQSPRMKTGSLLRTVSRFLSPTEVLLPEKPSLSEVVALQPKIARRGDKHSRVPLGVLGRRSQAVSLPFAGVSIDTLNSVQVYVGGLAYTRVSDPTNIDAGEWAFSKDFREILLPEDLPEGSQVEFTLGKERLFLEQRTDGYYHKTELLFDPDKENIQLSRLSRNTLFEKFVLPKNKTVVVLGKQHIVPGSVQLHSSEEVEYVEVNTMALLESTEDSYLVDYPGGVLRLHEPLDLDTVSISFEYQDEIMINDSHYEIVYENNLPWGIKIDKASLATHDVEERIGDLPFDILDIVSTDFSSKGDLFSTTSRARALSHTSILQGSVHLGPGTFAADAPVVEIPFIDGETEFLGLVPVLSERTSAILAGSSGYVEFSLSAGALWHQPLGISFSNSSVFEDLVSTKADAEAGPAGKYHVSSNGLVTVYVGSGNSLPTGITMSYFYKNIDFEPRNKFSVDYSSGNLYSYSSMLANGRVSYKAVSYQMSYDVALLVPGASYNPQTNSVTVRTENLHYSNSLLKILWFKSLEDSAFEELKDYFSPAVSLVGFRFH